MTSTFGSVDVGDNPFGESITDEWLDSIEKSTNIWNSSAELQQIAHLAQPREVSAWGLLLALQVHQMSLIEPNVVLVSRTGKHGYGLTDAKATSIFAALIAPTGGGKSEVIGMASSIIPPSSVLSDGTGQGIARSFAETKLVTDDDQGNKVEPFYVNRYLAHSLVMHAPEIDDLSAEFGREGSKTSGTLRKMWVGEITGSTTGDINRRVTLRPNTYRFGGLWGIQPKKAAPLMDGADGGTPQRWTWAPAEEFRDNLVRPSPSTPAEFKIPIWSTPNGVFGTSTDAMPRDINKDTVLPDPIWVEWSPLMQSEIPAMQNERREARVAARRALQAGKLTPELEAAEQRATMESHLILTRIKVAAGMAFLHGRKNPTDDDWRLAGIQIEVSKRCLAEAWAESKRASYGELTKKGFDRGIEQFAAKQSLDAQEMGVTIDLAHTVWKKLAKNPQDRRLIVGGSSKKQRLHITDAIDLLMNVGVKDSVGQSMTIRPSLDGRFFAFHNGCAVSPDGFVFTEGD